MSGLTVKLEGLARFTAAERLRQAEDAVRRAQLMEGLMASLAAQAALKRELRDQLLARWRAARPARRERRAGALDRALARLGSAGQAVVIARSGLWRTTGRPLHDLRHMAAYARRGANPAVQPLAHLHQAWYLENDPNLRTSPLVHYVLAGRAEARAPHPLVAPGHRGEPHDPHPLFSTAHYLMQRPQLAETGGDLLLDYLEDGWAHDVSPHPLFDPAWYRAQLPHEEAAQAPLLHYLAGGWRRGFKPHPLFDPAWYLRQYEDVAELGAEPLTHFVESGAAEGRSPSPWFDLPHYAAIRGAELGEGNPLIDYLDGGAWSVGEARPGVPTAAYLAMHPELVAEGRTPLDHWARLAKPGIAS